MHIAIPSSDLDRNELLPERSLSGVQSKIC